MATWRTHAEMCIAASETGTSALLFQFRWYGPGRNFTSWGTCWWHKDTRPWDEILAPGVPLSSLAPLPRGSADARVHIGRLEGNELKANYVAANTIVVRKERAGKALWFPEDLPTFEDWEYAYNSASPRQSYPLRGLRLQSSFA